VLWLVAGEVFAQYLAEFAFTYAIYYAGLASVIIALVFLYFLAAIFVLGGELNAAIIKARRSRDGGPQTAPSQAPGETPA
jgi:membrane protein